MSDAHLSSGQLFDVKQNVYVSPAGVTSSIGRVVLTNTTESRQTVEIYREDTTEYLLEKVTIPAGIGKFYIVNTLNGAKLAGGHKITMKAGTDNEINYQIDGKTTT